MDIPWEREGSLLQSSAGGEALVARGALRQLVATFLEMATEQRRGVAIRIAGPDWTSEYGDAEIRALAARPEYRNAPGGRDQAAVPGGIDRSGEAKGAMGQS